jgi:fumarate hydratase class II
MTEERTARDSMGEIMVPATAYWDAQTARARENFPISGTGPRPTFIRASGIVKWATATANTELGLL